MTAEMDLTVRIVSTYDTGGKVVETRTWQDCKKGKTQIRTIPPPGDSEDSDDSDVRASR